MANEASRLNRVTFPGLQSDESRSWSVYVAELIGTLRSDFVSTQFVASGLKLQISVTKDESAGKVAGLQKNIVEYFIRPNRN